MNKLKSSLLRIGLLKNQGFTLLEVLVGIIIITTFTLTALQALVISTVFRVRAAEKSGATAWIQENIEEAKFLGEDKVSEDCSPECGSALEDKLPDAGSTSVTWGEDEDGNDITFYSIGNETRQFLGKNEDGDQIGREVWLLRNTEPDGDKLILRYIAVLDDNDSPTDPDNDNDIVAELNTEVIPDAAFD